MFEYNFHYCLHSKKKLPPLPPLSAGKSYGVEVVWMDSTAAEADLWQRMLESDGEWVKDVLPLRMFVLAKSMSKWEWSVLTDVWKPRLSTLNVQLDSWI